MKRANITTEQGIRFFSTRRAPSVQKPAKRAMAIGWLCWLFFFAAIAGCDIGQGFDDESFAIVRKPSLLLIVLEPPIAKEGEQVKATPLFVDSNGVIDAPAAVWRLHRASNQFSNEANLTTGESLGGQMMLTPISSLEGIGINTPYEFELSKREEADSEDGEAFALEIAINPMHASGLTSAMENGLGVEAVNELLKDETTRHGFRSVPIDYEKSGQAKNPIIRGIALRGGVKSEVCQAVFVACNHDDIETKRRMASQAATRLSDGLQAPLILEADIEEGKKGAFRYRWFATAGKLEKADEALALWTPPPYRRWANEAERTATEKQASGLLVCHEAHQDTSAGSEEENPNLYPIWLVVFGDEGVWEHGASWAEFYVRVVR